MNALTLDVALFVTALLLGLLAAWTGRTRQPALEWERLFKVALAALLEGRFEEQHPDANKAAADAWERRLAETVWFHPAWREAWLKLENPEKWTPPVPSRDGEVALLEILPRKKPGTERFEAFFCGEHRDGLLEDPRSLGIEYDPARLIAPGLTWEQVARWDEATRQAVTRRLDHLRVIVFHETDDDECASGLFSASEPFIRVERHLAGAAPEARPAETAARLLADLDSAATRLALVGIRQGGRKILEMLADSPDLRDRTASVTLIGTPVLGLPGDDPVHGENAVKAWMNEHFSQTAMDVELNRSIPYVLLPVVRPEALPPGDGVVPWRNQRCDEPPIPPSGRRPIRLVELGPIGPAVLAEPGVLGQALLLLWIALPD